MEHSVKLRNFLSLLLLFIFACSITSCIEIKEEIPALIRGEYRGVLLLERNPYKYYDDDSPARQKTIFLGISDLEVPFNFDVGYEEDGQIYIVLKNGEERIKIDDISYGTDRRTSHDTMRITFADGQAYIYAEYAEKAMQGYYRNMERPLDKIPFNAFYGDRYRFLEMPEEAKADFNGTMDFDFKDKLDSSYHSMVTFVQDGNNLTGEISGDFFQFDSLEGIVENERFWLSYFNGEKLCLFNGKVINDEKITGFLKTGLTETYSAEIFITE